MISGDLRKCGEISKCRTLIVPRSGWKIGAPNELISVYNLVASGPSLTDQRNGSSFRPSILIIDKVLRSILSSVTMQLSLSPGDTPQPPAPLGIELQIFQTPNILPILTSFLTSRSWSDKVFGLPE